MQESDIWKPNFRTKTYKYFFAFILIAAGSFVFLSLNKSAMMIFLNKRINEIIYLKEKNKTTRKENLEATISHYHTETHITHAKRFTINTTGCSIPFMHPFDKAISEYIENPEKPKSCPNSDLILLDNNSTHIWINFQTFYSHLNVSKHEKIKCCYAPFYRPVVVDITSRRLDERLTYGLCKYFTDSIKVADEFVEVTCSVHNGSKIYKKYFLFTPEKRFVPHERLTKPLKEDSPNFNVIIMGIDAVSRLNFHRTMRKTLSFLQKLGAVELLGYNKVGDNTFPNLVPMLMGIDEREIQGTCLPSSHLSHFDNCPFVWEWYKQAGYYTALAEDSGWLGTFTYTKNGFIGTPTDYYPHTFIMEAERKVGTVKAMNAVLCLGEKYFYQVLLDYIQDLTNTLRLNKLFGFFWEISMSHDDLNYPLVMDNSYTKFFEDLFASGYLNKTVLFLVSDHGIRWGGIRSTTQGRVEERLPFNFILLPPSFRNYYSEAFNNLKTNRKRLTTPYDLHATLLDLINLKNIENEQITLRSNQEYAKQRSISLFLPIPENRTCEMASIDDHWCTCSYERKISRKSHSAQTVATYLVEHLNNLLNNYKDKCAHLQLEAIQKAAEIVVGKPDKDEDKRTDYLIVVQTQPGRGIFEGTVRNSTLGWNLEGTVSRLNLYGDQSKCVDDAITKLYCYCLEA